MSLRLFQLQTMNSKQTRSHMHWRGRTSGPPLSQLGNFYASHGLDGGSLVERGIGKLECLDRRRSFEHI